MRGQGGPKGEEFPWIQQLIAAGLSIGVSKRELFEHYYLDEFPEVIRLYGEMNSGKDPDVEEVFIDQL